MKGFLKAASTLVLASGLLVLGACSKKGDEGPIPGGGTPPVKRVFVTTATYMGGDIGGLSGADAKCNAGAAAAGLGGTWKAWMSDSTTDAIDRLSYHGPWYFAADINTLVLPNYDAVPLGGFFTPLVPINMDPTGATTLANGAWTGNPSTGRRTSSLPAEFCGDWTDNNQTARVGSTASTSASWTTIGGGGLYACNGFSNVLYCLEQ